MFLTFFFIKKNLVRGTVDIYNISTSMNLAFLSEALSVLYLLIVFLVLLSKSEFRFSSWIL